MAPRVNGSEYQAFPNIAATTAGFTLLGGQYAVQVTATFGGGSVTMQRLALDGTFVTCVPAFTAATYATVNLPPGTYRFTIATATAVYAELLSIVEA